MSHNFAKLVRMYGIYATCRFAANLGLDFEACYIAAFNRLPRV